MNPTVLGVIGPGFLNQVPTLLPTYEFSYKGTLTPPTFIPLFEPPTSLGGKAQ